MQASTNPPSDESERSTNRIIGSVEFASQGSGEAITIISHELRNSLGVVRNAARLMGLQQAAQAIQRARVLIERHVEYMNRHINELLDMQHQQRREILRLSYVD